uniref:Uncharacterized protein n=1 Tax=Ralstonia solanacearum TaxID=305 RepID=A0A0S4VXB2_RALSL|nr:protein of unknown function [Ralstonia solanacearum]CUV24431.1 protein of unknown function [Ralstonia solanacearum]CUV31688.1 protein of unknown function [Ralstonia solanacearum]CUV35623.1 protein of unknown function [Ralstonia solanacearum]CUV39083.1 protein of unknown function [Ralstonia solanacearum]
MTECGFFVAGRGGIPRTMLCTGRHAASVVVWRRLIFLFPFLFWSLCRFLHLPRRSCAWRWSATVTPASCSMPR